MAYLGTEHWRIAAYIVPCIVALICVVLVLLLVKRRPVEEGLPTVDEISHEESVTEKVLKNPMTVRKICLRGRFSINTYSKMRIHGIWSALTSSPTWFGLA